MPSDSQLFLKRGREKSPAGVVMVSGTTVGVSVLMHCQSVLGHGHMFEVWILVFMAVIS